MTTPGVGNMRLMSTTGVGIKRLMSTSRVGRGMGGGAVCSLEASLELAPDIHKSPYATDSTKDRIF